MARKPKETPHLRLRPEASLLARLEKAAEKNQRTLTGEINHRLEASFKRDDLEAQAAKLHEEWQAHSKAQTEKLIEMIKHLITNGLAGQPATAKVESTPSSEARTLGGLFNYKPEDSEK